jgi:PAS domain S-box-containing protein
LELKRFNQTLKQVLILPIVACLLLAGALVWQIEKTNATVRQIEQADRRIALLTRMQKLIVDEETGLRGFQVTSDQRFLQPYYDARAPFEQTANEFRSIANSQQKEFLRQAIAEHDSWHQTFAEPVIAIIRAGGRADDDDLNLTGRSRMDAVRSLLDQALTGTEKRRTSGIDLSDKQIADIYIVLFVMALAIGLIIGLFTRNRLEAVSAAFRRSLDLQRRRTEELFHSEQNLRTTLASIGDGVITCNIDGKIQMMNPVAQELTGWLESQAQNRPLEEVFHIVNESTREPVETPVAKVKRLNGVVGIANHTVLIRKDGSEVSIDDSGAPIRNEAGELTGIVMVFRDITMERRTRAALLANEKLAVAGRLAATIAHEIHNPLDSVANLLYLLQHDPNDSEAKHFLDIAQSELARVTQISRAMLSLYRESKAPVPVNLKEMLDDLLLLMVGRFQTLGVKISSEIPPEIIIEGFPAELRQVFTNLITNAAEAAGEGGAVCVRVTPRQAFTDSSGQRHEAGATVEIIDNGPGIPPEVQERLFQPFFTTKGERGTGLGLWVSHGIIRKHGGTLELDSRTEGMDHGATATVFLASKPVIDPGGD